MKALKILTHPILLMISFLFILISGEHLGGFYALYLLLALPYGGMHSLIALAGILVLVISYNVYGRKPCLVQNILNIIGALLLVLSLISFFVTDKEGYNYGTFYQIVPVISLSLFGLLALLFLIKNVVESLSKRRMDTKVSY
jgi:hypothetical protein